MSKELSVSLGSTSSVAAGIKAALPYSAVETAKAWETVAVLLSGGREALKISSPFRSRGKMEGLDQLEKIPSPKVDNKKITKSELEEIKSYLHKVRSMIRQMLNG